jgi:hypothetical protein
VSEKFAEFRTMSECDMGDAADPKIKSIDDLSELIRALTEREHDYGTCCYAMSIAAVAAFKYVAGALGVSGFQASCADLDILRRTRRLKHGFSIVDYENLLYPQYCNAEHFPGWEQMIRENISILAGAAKERIESTDHGTCAHPDVLAHWKWIVSLADEQEVKP